MTNIYDKSSYYITAQMKAIREHPKKEKRLGRPFVTISRESGAYGTTITQMLAEYLQKNDQRKTCPWTVFDKNLIEKVAQEHHLPKEIKQYLSEKPAPAIEDSLEELMGVHPSQEVLVNKMNETMLHLAQLGYSILVGRGAHIVTRQIPKGLHVRLIGSLEKRIKHMQDYLNVGEKQAKECVLREDRERRNYIHKYFRKDINAVPLYDLIINTDTVSPEEAVVAIGNIILHRSAAP